MTYDGGSAFPTAEFRNGNGNAVVEAGYGMSLRDWFAGQALQGWIASLANPHSNGGTLDAAKFATAAYAFADAMLVEQKRTLIP